MTRGKKYTNDYKKMISNLYKSGMRISEISKEYGVATSTINGWIKNDANTITPNDKFININEIAKLKNEIVRLTEENEILKKALIILAKKD